MISTLQMGGLGLRRLAGGVVSSNAVSNLALTSNLTDSKGKVWTANGNAAVSGGFLQLDGAGDSLTTPNSPDFDFGTGEFCVEAFVTIPAAPSAEVAIITKWGVAPHSWFLGINSARKLVFYYNRNTVLQFPTTTGTVPTATETHVAAYLKSGVIYGAIGGTVEVLASFPAIIVATSQATAIGSQSDGTTSPFTGQIRHVRTIKGSSPYGASNFTPPAPPLSD